MLSDHFQWYAKKLFRLFLFQTNQNNVIALGHWEKNLSKFVLSATYLPGKNFSANFLWKNFRSLQFFVTLRKIILYCVFKTVVQLHRGDNLGQKYEFLEELGLFVFFFPFLRKNLPFWDFLSALCASRRTNSLKTFDEIQKKKHQFREIDRKLL